MDISGAPLRALRAALFSALCVTMSAAAHVLLSGAPLPALTVTGLSVGVFAIAYAVAGRERRFGAIAGLLIPLELAADTVFTAGQHACYGHAGGPVAGPLRSVGVDLLCRGGDFGTPLARMASRDDVPPLPHLSSDPMTPWLLLAVHVAVGLVAAAWLRRGETALARLVRAAAGFAFRPLLIAVASLSHAAEQTIDRSRPAFGPPTSRLLPLLAHSVGRRGPPCPTAF
ncbi:hypothetical protein [Streptomyces sp. NPDC047108]|uniref:hypothetical protein n=1 Tax=Streptomyces sp. NPDC047108 TaxID=3155025 RepID=UPI0033F9545D